MNYTRLFEELDVLTEFIDGIANVEQGKVREKDYILSKLTGFYAVSICSVVEVSLKRIVVEFATEKSDVFANYISSVHRRMNAKVSYGDLGELLKRFGGSYHGKFNLEPEIRSSYESLLTCRNQFAHEGIVPAQISFEDLKRGCKSAQLVVERFHAALQ